MSITWNLKAIITKYLLSPDGAEFLTNGCKSILLLLSPFPAKEIRQTETDKERSEWSNQALISITSPWMTDAPPADDDDGHLERKELDSMAIDHQHLRRRRRRGWRRNASLIISD